MNIIADTHTHTVVSGDAFSTLYENLDAARRRGLSCLCLTEHVFSVLPGAPRPSYFRSLHALPREFEGVRLVRGVEANVIDYEGQLDMPCDILACLEWVIASMHTGALMPGDRKSHTAAWMAVAENPFVDVIGHCGDPKYAFDIDETVRAFHRHGKIVEINSQSARVRPGSHARCVEIAGACKHYGVPVVVSSDAHFVDRIGVFTEALSLLDEVGFPEELVLNADAERFSAFLAHKQIQP